MSEEHKNKLEKAQDTPCEKVKKWWASIAFKTKYMICMVAVLVGTHILFKCPAPVPCLVHVWEAGDIITFAGTIILGYMTYMQNTQANETNKRILEQQRNEFALSNSPKVICYLKNIKVYHSDGNKKKDNNYVSLVFENIGNDIANDIKVAIKGIDFEGNLQDDRQIFFKNNLEKLRVTPFSLSPNSKLSIPISKSENLGSVVKETISVTITYQYRNLSGQIETRVLPEIKLLITEFNLFNLEETNGQTENAHAE